LKKEANKLNPNIHNFFYFEKEKLFFLIFSMKWWLVVGTFEALP